MAKKRHAVAATLCAAALFAPNAADSLMLIPCGTMTDHYVKVDKEERRTVIKGDTLWEISRDVYGDPTRFPEIAKLSRIDNPELIFPEQEVRIPRGEGYEFLGRRYDITGHGFCAVTDKGGYQYTGRVNHPKYTTRDMIH